MRSPENGAARCQPWDSGLVSRWPVRTTRGPGPKLTSPRALGRPGSTSCSSTEPKPDSRMTEARNPASSPSPPSTLGMRQTCRTSSTARSRSRLPSTAPASPGLTMSTVIRSLKYPISDLIFAAQLARGRGPGRRSAAIRHVLVRGDQRGVGGDLDELVLLHPVAEALPGRLVDAAGLLPGRWCQQRERVGHAALQERDLVLGHLLHDLGGTGGVLAGSVGPRHERLHE